MWIEPLYKIGDLALWIGERSAYEIVDILPTAGEYIVVENWVFFGRELNDARYHVEFNRMHANSRMITREELFLKKMES